MAECIATDNTANKITKMREVLAADTGSRFSAAAQEAVRALMAYEHTLDGEIVSWPSDLSVDEAILCDIVNKDLKEIAYGAAESANECEARAYLLCERIMVEREKKKLLVKFGEAYTDSDNGVLARAMEFAERAHLGQLRDSGQPYLIHPLAVSEMLIDMGMDADTAVAGLLHDVVEDNKSITIEQLGEQFGPVVMALVDGVTKLTKATFAGTVSREEQQAENVRKMFLAMAKDIRVIPIKLADRLHNMRTLEYCRSEKRFRKAQETLEIYAPLAHRLGMGMMKCELEDLSFMHLNPIAFGELKEKVERMRSERSDFLNEAMTTIRAKLDEAHIVGSINGRPKHIYSIYRKMQKQGTAFEQIYDLIAVRVIVKSIEDCYSVLGMVHSIWRPLPFRIKDYISTPKPNMYQSLHTTLIGDNGIPFEVQIRTEEMHKMAEYGIAAHWKYKEGRDNSNDLDNILDWVRQLMDEKIEDSAEFMRVLKVDFFSDLVFVFTPQGKILDLVAGSTPIDFAYRIHSQVGNSCVGAKVNGKIVPLDHALQMGDIVEIITSSTIVGPSRDWLKIVKTQQAKSKIKQWFKKELKEENIVKGRDMLEREAKRQGYAFSQIAKPDLILSLFKKLSINSAEDLYAAVGYGSISTAQVIPKLIEEQKKVDKEAEKLKLLEQLQQKQTTERPKQAAASNSIIVKGESNMLVRIARCCTPVPGDEIVGYITRGRGVSVHRADCKNLGGLDDEQMRFIEVEWADSAGIGGKFHATVHIKANERPGLVLDVSQLFMNMNVTLGAFSAKNDKNLQANIVLEFEVRDSAHLNFIIKQIKKIAGVQEVFRVNA